MQAAAAPSPRNDASPSSPRSCPRTHGTTRRLKSFHSSPYRNSHPASARIALPQSRRPSGSKSAGVGTAFRNTNNRSSRATFPRADLADLPPVTRPRAADSVCCRWFINLIVLSLVKSFPPQASVPRNTQPPSGPLFSNGRCCEESVSQQPVPAPAGPDSAAVSVKIIVMR